MYRVMQQRFTLYSIAAFFSIILSVWAAFKTSVLNPDAICYLFSAAEIEKGLSLAAHLCEQAKWPFYSAFIYSVAKITHLSFIHAAFLLNGFFSFISVVTFIAIISSLTTQIRVRWLAAVVILLAHTFNHLRVEIIRDHGFWAFYLVSVFFLLRFFQKNQSWRDSGYWSASLIFATLFRIEGIIFLLLLPFVAFVNHQQKMTARLSAFFQLNGMTLLGIVVLIVWIILHPEQSLGRLTEVQFQFMHGVQLLIQSFQHTASALTLHVLNPYAHDASWVAIGMFSMWYVFNVISNVSIIYAILIIYVGLKKLTHFSQETRWVLSAYILINILITMVFLVENVFLARRYLVALSLILMLWVPFALDHLIAEWHKRKWPVLLAFLAIVIYGMGGIFDLNIHKI